ncbi:MAG TPA: SDR family oxidoreductase, partial [Flavisolibacter sp.]|nr:SDR family oxidoreductase [Flavisolibacter sp.]
GLKGGNKKHSYADVEVARVQIDEETGVKVLLKEAWNRYQQPIALTEVHLHCHREEQLRWFKYIYESCSELSAEGVAITAITSWAILGSFGWNKLLTVPRGEYEPGAYDMRSGVPRATALVAYIKNIASHTGVNQHLTSDKGWWQRDTRLIYRPAAVELNAVKFNYDVRPVAIIGRTGTLGKAFAKVCSDRAINNVLLGREDCDISEPYTIERIIQRYKPWAIINAAGYVKVDEAEADAETCFRNNFVGAYNLAAACHRHDIQLATFSSDLVFDGTKRQPYIESDVPNALNVYGKSKQLGEEHVLLANPSALVIRTSAFFGPYDEYNFLHWVETNLVNQIEVPAANDIYISPTYVPDLVHTTLDLLIDGEKGIWHLANEGAITWADLAYLTAKQLKFNGNLIKAVPSSHLNLAAQRPEYTVLGTEKGQMLPSLKNALERYFAEKKRFAMLAG